MNLTITNGDTSSFSYSAMTDCVATDLTGIESLTFTMACTFPTPLRFVMGIGTGVTIADDPTTGDATLVIASGPMDLPNVPLVFQCSWVLVDSLGNPTTTEAGTLSVVPHV